MNTTLTLQHQPVPLNSAYGRIGIPRPSFNSRVSRLHGSLIWILINIRILYFACAVLKRPGLILKTFRALLRLRSNVWGGNLKKFYRVGGRYYFNQYTPGWPSRAYDELIKGELRRHADPLNVREKLSFIFLAITRKCPMRCEHCFEWDNLNQKEVLSYDDLKAAIDLFQDEGVLQIHFSGGEPMVRCRELVGLISHASKKSECWVLTSGFHFTAENAKILKDAGCRGVVVSIDHYLAEAHDLFRGRKDAFGSAVRAVKYARAAGMLVSISVCATRAFIEGGHLMPYMEFARDLGVQFVQVLEPKNVGHYADQNVLLAPSHIEELERVFTLMNHSAQYRHHPTMLYHGYHQRRVGCFSGSRSVYIDSVGDVHACPFCHTKSYNIIDLVRNGNREFPVKANSCPRYATIA